MHTTSDIPIEVKRLCAREREVATIVYYRGAATAKDVEADLSAELSNGAVRSMLVRLVAKGVLTRRWGARGRGHQFIYMPAVTPEDVKRRALKTVTNQFFDGSLLSVARALFDLIEATEAAVPGWSEPFRIEAQSADRVDLAA